MGIYPSIDHAPLLDTLHRICLRRGALVTRCLLAHQDRGEECTGPFNQDASGRGFSVMVVARETQAAKGVVVYALDWHAPLVLMTLRSDTVLIDAELPSAWMSDSGLE